MLQRPTDATVNWDTLHNEGGNLSVAFVQCKPRHIAIIPDEVLEDGLATRNEEPVASARRNSDRVESAIRTAFKRRDWRELVRIDDGTKLFQLWVVREDFDH